MAGTLGSANRNKVLDYLAGATRGADQPATMYLALYTVAPTYNTAGTEPTTGSYARLAVTNDGTNFGAAASGFKTNATQLVMVTATANWGSIIAVSFMDALTVGNLVLFGLLASPIPITTGQTPVFNIGSLSMSAT